MRSQNALTSAYGYKRTFTHTVIYVRFTPESRHRDGCRFTSACDPKQTFIAICGSAGGNGKPEIYVVYRIRIESG